VGWYRPGVAGAVLALSILGTIWVVAWAAVSARSRRANDALAVVGRLLDGAVDPGTASVHGRFHGVATTFRLATRGGGSASERWTEIDCELPRGYPVVLHLRRHTSGDQLRIARGEMVDVVVGDLRFDDQFLVEGAPDAVIRRLLSPEVRGYLVGHSVITLDTVDDRLRLAVDRCLMEPREAEAAILCVTSIAASLRAATYAVEAEVPPADAADPYRGVPDDRPIQEARAARGTEVAEVAAVRERRIASDRGAVLFAVALMAMALLATVCGVATQ
jgi:hypothetical protein